MSSVSTARRPTSDLAREPGYFTRYKNFAVSRSASGVLTLPFHTSGGPHTFDGTTHHDFPRLLEDIAFGKDNRIPCTGHRPSMRAGAGGQLGGCVTAQVRLCHERVRAKPRAEFAVWWYWRSGS
jgi:hypothetical protein